MTAAPRVTGLFVHPVKSMALRPLHRARLLPRGLADDRSWVLVDAHGVLVSARTDPQLLAVEADTPSTDPTVTHALRLRSAGLPDHAVEVPDGSPVPLRLHRNDLTGVPADEEAQRWVRAAVGRDDVRLLWCQAPEQRRLNPAYSRPGDHTAYADGYPVTLASEDSLRQLNDWVAQEASRRGEAAPVPMTMARFRPNVVVAGTSPFEEDGWRRVRIGDTVLRMARPTDRCVMTTFDPQTLARGKEPLRTLAKHRRWDSKTWFAVNLVPEVPGTVAVGDEVVVED
ncbi:MOSC domain-containing protein [Nocardioides jishulii]|uniref:MOSC domain-containing protein n=1 Tax=Nocardioides jishulii TaxID=2575440 RepID=A0A4U2YKS5_9ACTN|nr:MOSC N-terminal beta barrel domain-containing protein [Nocardioides jishulii]QCX27251.1 MOSC domain-containing protein [Nocardioides jishulii]TKI61738.1 MOSC domain-containing protein [Nocardioides jishulii]